ncbi:MAG: hypothetical protein ACAH12_08220 [Methylophilaceae bacterium]
MKSLIKKFITKPVRDPIASHILWLDDLEGMDDLTALHTATQHLAKLRDDILISDEEIRLAILTRIDEHNNERILKVLSQYTKFENLRPELESRISETTYYYYRQLFLNYRKHIDLETKKPEINKPQLLLLLIRTMRAAFAMVKLRYYRHQPAPDAVWLQIFSLYKTAEEKGLLNQPIKPYEGTRTTTLSATLVQALLLDSVDQSNMRRQEIDLVAQILKKLMADVKITDVYNEKEFLFYMDLAVDKGGRRVRNFTPTPTCRYWNMDNVSLAFEVLIQSKNLKLTLEKFALEQLASYPELPELIQQLHSEWAKNGYRRQRRKEERNTTLRTATITFGIETICTQIKYLSARNAIKNARVSDAKSFEERLSSHTVAKSNQTMSLPPYMTGGQWTITDESPKGYGALVNKEFAKPLKPDMLIGLVIENEKDTVVIGTIKSVKVLPTGQSHIGVEVLSKQPSLIQMTPTEKKDEPVQRTDAAGALNIVAGFQGLYLGIEAGISESVSIVLPRLKFQYHAVYQISSAESKSILKLGAPIEAKEDWARVELDTQI